MWALTTSGVVCVLGCLALGGAVSQPAPVPDEDRTATFSIVAHDVATGETGVAFKTRAFRGRILFAKAGVGAVVTQASPNMTYGPEGLKLLESGLPAAEVVKRLTDADAGRADRQMGVVDVHGRAAAYTGADNWYAAAHIVGDGFAVQGNGLENERVVPAMARAFREAKGELADRLLAALAAGRALGGDGRGYGSNGIQVVKGARDPSRLLGPYWVDINVDYSRDPIKDLHLLLTQTKARRLTTAATTLAREGKMEEAVNVQESALALLPDDDSLQYRLAERYADAGRLDDAIRELRLSIAISPAWRNAIPRSPSFQKVRHDPRFAELAQWK